jgi:predicted DNA-binding transcriptional regulator YafY
MSKRQNQKLKTLYVAQYFLENSDENHSVNASDIRDYLKDEHKIICERRSIYSDISALRDEFGMDIESVKGGKYRLLSRQFNFEDLRLLAQCVYATKFISENRAHKLVETIGEFCSIYQREELEAEVFLCDRVKTTENNLLFPLSEINYAMSTRYEGKPRKPSKITFKYTKYTIDDIHSQVECRKGSKYKVSPYKLIINGRNYYLLAYDDRYKDMRTCRVDRMQEVKATEEPREGNEIFDGVDLRTYTKRVFSMFSGENKRVSMRFNNSLLSAVIERFGNKSDVTYRPDGKSNFIVIADVEISDQFYAWMCGFRKRASIVHPPEVVEGMKNFLKDIESKY